MGESPRPEDGAAPGGEASPTGENSAAGDVSSFDGGSVVSSSVVSSFAPSNSGPSPTPLEVRVACNFAGLVVAELPQSYRENTPEEDSVLDHVQQFRREHSLSARYDGPKRGQRPVPAQPNQRGGPALPAATLQPLPTALVELHVAPENECGIKKSLPSFVHAAASPHPELHELESCARFVSDFVRYEALDIGWRMPAQLQSPSTTARWQAGNSFDMANLLASLLIGAGFDAYVCCGLARLDLCVADEALRKAPEELLETRGAEEWIDTYSANQLSVLPPLSSQAQAAGDVRASDYDRLMKTPTSLESKFIAARAAEKKEKVLQEQLEKRAEILAAERKPQAPAEPPADQTGDEPASEPKPELTVSCHAWVLVLPGPRDVKEALFVDVATGRTRPVSECAEASADFEGRVKDPPYHKLTAIWNHRNLWANLRQHAPVHLLSFELNGEALVWAPLFNESEPIEGSSTDLSEKPGVISWVPRIEIPAKRYGERFPDGKRRRVFIDAVIDQFSPSQPEGITKMVTTFKEETSIPIQRVEYLSRRQDRLYRRVRRFEHSERYAETGEELIKRYVRDRVTTTEHFAPTALNNLKTYTLVEPIEHAAFVATLDSEFQHPDADEMAHESDSVERTPRKVTMEFYPNRSDGLITRIVTEGFKLIEHYAGRTDKVEYRSVKFQPDGSSDKVKREGPGASFYDGVSQRPALHMKQKFGRNTSRPPHADPQELKFDFHNSAIVVQYHRDDAAGKLVPSKRHYSRIDASCTGFTADPSRPSPSDAELHEDFQTFVYFEKDCLVALRAADKELRDMEENLASEREDSELFFSFHDARKSSYEQERAELAVASHMSAQLLRRGPSSGAGSSSAEGDSMNVEEDFVSVFVSPFLRKPGARMDAETARVIYDRCMASHRERQRNKKMMIRQRLEKEKKSLKQRMQRLQQHSQAAEEASERFQTSQTVHMNIQVSAAAAQALHADENMRKEQAEYRTEMEAHEAQIALLRRQGMETRFRVKVLQDRLHRQERDEDSRMREMDERLRRHPALSAFLTKHWDD